MFADDSLLFCKGINSACTTLKTIIDKFFSLLGQLVNFHKSSIVFSKMINNTRRGNLSGVFNMNSSISLGRHLGARFLSFKPTKNDYKFIMEKNGNRINSWHTHYLSKAGRFTLIQSNLEAFQPMSARPFYFYKRFVTTLIQSTEISSGNIPQLTPQPHSLLGKQSANQNQWMA